MNPGHLNNVLGPQNRILPAVKTITVTGLDSKAKVAPGVRTSAGMVPVYINWRSLSDSVFLFRPFLPICSDLKSPCFSGKQPHCYIDIFQQ
jgi:hypothetical protein